jgi:hypothetical protein
MATGFDIGLRRPPGGVCGTILDLEGGVLMV